MGGLRSALGMFLMVFVVGAHSAPVDRLRGFDRLHAEGRQPSILRLYFMPTAPIKLDWDTPRQLLLSTVKASAFNKSHPIGHVSVEVQLQGLDDSEHHVFTGASGSVAGASKTLLLKDDLGFSILERAWPGLMEVEADLAKSLDDRAKHAGRMAVATFLINDDAARRLIEYVRTLRADPTPKWYGFAARPQRGEGSGCSAFGASFLDEIGALNPALRRAWSREVRVPLILMAGYLGQARIGLAKAVVHKAAHVWAKPSDPHMLLQCFDPDLMFEWTLRALAAPGEIDGLVVQPDTATPRLLDARYKLGGQAERHVKAVVIDAREFVAPTGPVLNGAPALLQMNDTRIPTVIRRDKVVGANGSFEVRP